VSAVYLQQFPSYLIRCLLLSSDKQTFVDYVMRRRSTVRGALEMFVTVTVTVTVIRTKIAKKIVILRTPAFIFCLPWGRPSGNHAKRCMNEKTIQCLPNPSQHLPIYLQQFPSYSNRKCKKSPFSRTTAHIFVSPGDAPGAITLNVVWMEREFDGYKLSR